MEVKLTNLITKPVTAIEQAAANCYDSSPDGSGRIMRACYQSGHHSVLEFADFTFHISGVSRALTHQLVRHRPASYAQRSQRYCMEDGFKYVIPPSIKNKSEALDIYEHCMDAISDMYQKLVDIGIPNEDARYVLPNACETITEIKVNGRELIHICNERLCSRAQWEIREMVKLMVKEVREYNDECAEFAKFLVPKCQVHRDAPFCTEHQSCGLAPKLATVYSTYLEHAQPKRSATPLILLVGKSGSGKTTIANRLCKDGYSVVQSYTTRAPRYEGEAGHTFVTEDEYSKVPCDQMMAYTYFDGAHYYVTKDMLDSNDVYVIDPHGVQILQENYKTSRRVVVFYLDTTTEVNKARMKARGDSEEQIQSRIKHDSSFDWLSELRNARCGYEMYIIDGNQPENVVYESVVAMC